MKLQELLEKIKNEMMLRNFSRKTIKSYLACLGDYFKFVKEIRKEPNIEIIKNYLLNKQKQGLSSQSINLYLQAIKYFYREIYKSNKNIDIKFAKTPSKLPIVLSRAEIDKILGNIVNQKHKLMVALAYGCGFRVSEVINLKIKDIDLAENTVHIKGQKEIKIELRFFPKNLKMTL
ncbi:MAG: tyrosine-type recombinase/integrase [Patescibacteria group bacterium]